VLDVYRFAIGSKTVPNSRMKIATTYTLLFLQNLIRFVTLSANNDDIDGILVDIAFPFQGMPSAQVTLKGWHSRYVCTCDGAIPHETQPG
jgi:hypothetical protein